MQRWQLVGYEVVNVDDFCANPDDDPGGEWCFVLDLECQSLVNWGYCAPTPRCSAGSWVLAPRAHRRGSGEGEEEESTTVVVEAARLTSFHGTQVTLLWDAGGGSGTALLAEVSTLAGDPCLYAKASAPPERPSPSGSGSISSSTSSSTELRTSSTQPPQPLRLPPFDPVMHGPALAMRLEWDYADIVVQRDSFERLLERVIARAVHQPREAVSVLAVLPGSVIAAIGIVPVSCAGADITSLCMEDLVGIRRVWLATLQNPESEIRTVFQQLDLSFPSILAQEDCEERRLPCPWFSGGPSQVAALPVRCQTDGDSATKCPEAPRLGQVPQGRHDVWWFVSLVAFAGATPTCLCFSLGSLKGFLLCWRWWRRRRRRREVLLETSALRRVEVLSEDLHVSEDWACAICLGETVAGTDLLLLPCKHTMHYQCMLEWMQLRLTCPMCRSRINLADCAVYTTPSSLEPSPRGSQPDGETEEEQEPTPRVAAAVSLQARAGEQEQPIPLPNAVVDEEAPL